MRKSFLQHRYIRENAVEEEVDDSPPDDGDDEVKVEKDRRVFTAESNIGKATETAIAPSFVKESSASATSAKVESHR